jgi:hypothetical protein
MFQTLEALQHAVEEPWTTICDSADSSRGLLNNTY